MSDAKSSGPSATRTAALKGWTARLSPVLRSVLLDDLIRLTAEYLLPQRLSWSPSLHSKRIAITDADDDGFGRSLRFTGALPAGVLEEESPHGWYVALSSAPLSELAGGSPVFSWAVRVDEWADNSLTVGVACADAKLAPPAYGVCDKAYGAYVTDSTSCPEPVHGGTRLKEGPGRERDMPPLSAGAAVQIRLTADLQANTVRVAVEHVPERGGAEESATDGAAVPLKRIEHVSWIFSVPDLAHCHLHAAAGTDQKLTLMP